MHRFLLAAFLALLASNAAAFPVDLNFDAADLDVSADVHSDGRLAAVRVVNNEDFAVRCTARFRNGPEQVRARHAIIPPGERTTLTWTPRRQVVRLVIELRCAPHGELTQ